MTPHCPLCDWPPLIVLGGGTRAFCQNLECDVLAWDPSVSLDENLLSFRSLTLEEIKIMSGCQARIPAGFLPGLWMICGEPVVITHTCRCACGHVLESGTCAGHVPVPGEVGCAQCFEKGHECLMEITEGKS